jgi:hypothetical protein
MSPRQLVVLSALLGFCLTTTVHILAAPSADLLPTVARTLGAREADLSLQTVAALPQPGQDGTVLVVLDGRPVTLNLVARSVRAPGFRVRVQTADGTLRAVPPPPPSTWRGTVADEPGSRVVASMVAGSLHASVLLPGHDGGETQWWSVSSARNVVPGAASDLMVVGREVDLPSPGGNCAVEGKPTERVTTVPVTPALQAQRASRSPAEVFVLELACDTDVEFYTANGSSIAATVADIEAVINGMSDLFELDLQTTFQVSDVIVRTVEPDPYTTTNPYALLTQLQSEWETNQQGVVRDLVQFFAGRDLDGSAIGIGFSDPGVCTTYYGYSIVQSRYSTTMANRYALSAHEISHNCDGSHCDYMDYICRIMCPSIGGCSCSLHSFGPWEVNDILAYLTSRPCLDTIEMEFPHATLPFTETFTAVNLDPTKWTAVDRAASGYGRLEIKHGGGSGSQFYLGTLRTLPIELGGPAEISYRVLPYGIIAGQRLKVEYFDTTTRLWVLLNTVVAPGGIPSLYTTYTHTTPPAAAGNLFCLRFSAYGDTGNSGTLWYLDDVSITAATVDVPPAVAAATLLRDVRPNPFNPRTTVALDLDRERHVELRIFDLAGRAVTTLIDGVRPAGTHHVTWNGCDDHGLAVPSGGYVIQLVSEGNQESRTVSLIR